jgi:hypothetical protein
MLETYDHDTVRVAAAVRITGLSRSRIYELIKIEVIKFGRAILDRYSRLFLSVRRFQTA